LTTPTIVPLTVSVAFTWCLLDSNRRPAAFSDIVTLTLAPIARRSVFEPIEDNVVS